MPTLHTAHGHTDTTEARGGKGARARAPPAGRKRRGETPELCVGAAQPRCCPRVQGAEGAEAPKILKAKGSKNVHSGVVHVAATFNNTIVSVSDPSGNVIGWSSAGKMGFRGSRKSTAYASQLVAQDACRQAMAHGLKQAEVRVKGPGAGRESAVRAVQGLGIDVMKITDVTPIPHNGCRPKKARRV